MKKNKIATASMIPILRQTLLHDLYHIKPLLHNNNVDKSTLTSLIELKESMLDLLPAENDALQESVSTPPKSLGNIHYYDKINKVGTKQFELLQMIERCERARNQFIEETLEKGLSPGLKITMGRIYKLHNKYLKKLDNQMVRP